MAANGAIYEYAAGLHLVRAFDRSQAQQVAEALRALGHEVWRDDELPAHRPYSEVIEERLQAAGAVVVLWSAEAVKSQWVRAEAEAAREKGTLIQVSVDGTVPPMPFNQIQCADLKGWDGDVSAPGWRKIEGSVAALIKPEGAQQVPAKRDKLSICVLPFQNMSGDAEQEYFSDGISEDITTDLSKISALAVIARNTAFTFKSAAVDVAEIARKLNVSHVLEGSVRKAGQSVKNYRPADRRGDRRASLGGKVRPRPDRHFRHPGRNFKGDSRCAQGETAAGRKRRRSSSAARRTSMPTISI